MPYLRTLSIAIAICFFEQTATAAPIIFSGHDEQAAPGAPRPNANAARSAFLAAAGAASVVDFENQAVGSSMPLNPVPGLTITFFNQGGDTIANGSDVVLGYNTTPGGSLFLRSASDDQTPTEITFTFSTPIEFFGMFLTGPGTGLGGVRLLFSDGAAQNFLIAGSESSDGGITFFGFTDFGSPVSSVTFRVEDGNGLISDDVIGIDDLLIPAAVPEPAAFALAGMGFAMAAFLRRKRQSKPRRSPVDC